MTKATNSKFLVYMHIAPNGKKYIGITSKTVEQRWNNGHGYLHNQHFYDAIKKYGADSFRHVVIAQDLSKKEACSLEVELIAKYKTTDREKGYNHSTGGDISAYGVKRSREYIEALRLRHLGKSPSTETRRKISEKLKGRPNCRKGVKLADNSKMKMSKPVICIETGIKYFGINEAERKTGVSSRNIGQCVLGNRKTAGSLHWKAAL